MLGRAELKPATGNVGILSGSLWEMGDKQEEGAWGSQGFAERGHGWCRGMWVNTTLASMHLSRTGRLLSVLQFAAHCPRKDHIPLWAVVALETVEQPCESSEKQRVWGDGPRLSPGWL